MILIPTGGYSKIPKANEVGYKIIGTNYSRSHIIDDSVTKNKELKIATSTMRNTFEIEENMTFKNKRGCPNLKLTIHSLSSYFH